MEVIQMVHAEEIKSVRLIYFSGTGGTKRITEAFEVELKSRGLEITVWNLGATTQETVLITEETELSKVDLNILLYPVYAMDAPRPVYDWISSISGSEAGKKIAVISVSGGGEMWPNKGCRNQCCNVLEEKDFRIVYDRMMVMPANVLVEYSDHLIMWLLNAIPQKTTQIIDDLLAGKIQRTRFRKGPVLRWISRMERENSYKFAQGFEVSNDCTGCGWCSQNCPVQNIEMSEASAKPKFLDRCVACTRCIYGCPSNAIKAKGGFAHKKGFDISAVEQRMRGIELEPLETCCKGVIYLGVRKYLRNLD